MTITKDNIKTWLKKSGRDRDWLGEELGVSKRTVDNWLSIQDIPDGKLRLIERLMADDQAEEARRKQLSEPTNQIFSLEVSLPRFRRYSTAAATARQTLEHWAIQSLDEMAETAPALPATPKPPHLIDWTTEPQDTKIADDITTPPWPGEK